jgi:hypothetical protein
MGSEIILSGVTFSNSIAKALPAIPNLQVLSFFGNSYDNININRVPGGPTLTPIGPAANYSSNAVNLGLNGITPTATAITSGGALTGAAIAIITPGSNLTSSPFITVGSGVNAGLANGIISGGQLTGASIIAAGSGLSNASPVNVIGGNYSYFNTGLIRTSASLAAGWTYAAVVRVTNLTGVYSSIFTDDNGTSNGINYQLSMRNQDGANSSLPTLSLIENGIFKQFITLPSSTAVYRFVAVTFSGGATGGVMNLYDLTDNLTAAPYNTPTLGFAGNETLLIGPRGTTVNNAGSTSNVPFDIAFAMVTSSPLSLISLQAIYASVKSSLARRVITI